MDISWRYLVDEFGSRTGKKKRKSPHHWRTNVATFRIQNWNDVHKSATDILFRRIEIKIKLDTNDYSCLRRSTSYYYVNFKNEITTDVTARRATYFIKLLGRNKSWLVKALSRIDAAGVGFIRLIFAANSSHRMFGDSAAELNVHHLRGVHGK